MARKLIVSDFAQDVLPAISDEDAGWLFRALVALNSGQDPPGTIPASLSVAWLGIRKQQQAFVDAYERTCEARRKAGRAGGFAKSSKCQQMLANAKKGDQILANASKCDKDKEKEKEKGITSAPIPIPIPYHTIPIPNPPPNAHAGAHAHENDKPGAEFHANEVTFGKFWNAYPRRVARPQARKAWLDAFDGAAPTDETMAAILCAIEFSRNSNEWKRDHGQYIPKPENWIKERRWEDKIDDLGPPTGQGGITGYQDKAATDLAAAANGIA